MGDVSPGEGDPWGTTGRRPTPVELEAVAEDSASQLNPTRLWGEPAKAGTEGKAKEAERNALHRRRGRPRGRGRGPKTHRGGSRDRPSGVRRLSAPPPHDRPSWGLLDALPLGMARATQRRQGEDSI